MLRAAVPSPCAICNAEELKFLVDAASKSEEAHWQYRVPVRTRCTRCSTWFDKVEDNAHHFVAGCSGVVGLMAAKEGWFGTSLCTSLSAGIVEVAGSYINQPWTYVSVPFPQSNISVLQRCVEASAVAEKGSKFRAHGSFIHHLSGLDCSDMMKDSMLSWLPYVLEGHMGERKGFSRKLLPGRFSATTDSIPVDTHQGNPDCSGVMMGTSLNGSEYGDEKRVQSDVVLPSEPRVLATQIGPDIQPTEVMESSVGNLKCGLKKRVDPLGFTADSKMKSKIQRTVKKIIDVVFTKEKIEEWRVNNPEFSLMASKKWSAERFANAWDSVLSEGNDPTKIEQEFQIKLNEALPAKDKAPRPIIQTGDKGQIMMMLPVKCFEDILFEYFEEASIKHLPKHDAMKRVAKRLRNGKKRMHVVEGDGSAWDSCCNPTIRDLTENAVMKHIIKVLGFDAEVPKTWMDAMLKDMQKHKIRGKAKIVDFCLSKVRVIIDSIRQSGHRGTSAFNWFVNFVCWLCVLCDNPEDMIERKVTKNGTVFLQEWYKSSRDGKWYQLRYAFEGDDSVISTTEDLSQHKDFIESIWKSFGFRMKLVYVEKKMTFTGFDFLCDDHGPVGIFIPEIGRNISSSSWSCSSLLKQHPEKVHEVGAAAMLARADNFRDFGPLSYYFASLGLAHARFSNDFSLAEKQAVALGIKPCDSVIESLHSVRDAASFPSKVIRSFVDGIVGSSVSHEEWVRLLSFECDDPCNTSEAMKALPKALWGIAGLCVPRRSPPGL